MMVLGTGIRERQLAPPGGNGQRSHQQHEPQPEQVLQGVVVNPPRESRVSVRVEIVSERDARESGAAATSWAEREAEPQATSQSEAMLAALATDGSPPSAARLGSADARRAVAAYGANADWPPYDKRPRPRLSIRA